eukprot:TRINITY_DN1757_c0_g1_i1.p1 TRINITY_DN1757_c0_g1~~TRINITY_DN1757_c0_g1_i1.p1  ORF type:complete len:726 (-),score=160.34 TRINITY_DN1757_c0_g1_i1:68-2245(-)
MQSAPDSFYCPILQTLMKNPVIDPDGNSYERDAIFEWLAKNPISPITRKPLKEQDLVPNRALKDIIENYLKSTTGPVEEKRELKARTSDKIKLTAASTVSETLIQILPPEGTTRTPVDICCVIDTSGSMGSEASVKTSTGKNETHGLVILDIVKHAVKTIIHALDANDRLGIVSFDYAAKQCLPLTSMSNAGRNKAVEKLESLDADGSTNLWDGLKTGLNLLKGDKDQQRLKVVLLLTDGEPTVVPPRGHIPMLRDFVEDNESAQKYLIFTFGFGYDLDSALLNDIAKVGNGTYAFIPDCNFVGTVFINSMANLSTTMATDMMIRLKGLEGASAVEAVGYRVEKVEDEFVLNAGSLRFGQSQEIVITHPSNGKDVPQVAVHLRYLDVHNKNELSETTTLTTPLLQKSELLCIHEIRLHAVQKLSQIIQLPIKESEKLIKDFIVEIKKSPVAKNEYILDLTKDLEGQVLESVADMTSWNRWGKHYLPSLAWAHLLQQCNNFKDPGVQKFGGSLFKKIQKEADKIFSDIPPPKPTFPSPQPAAPIVSMSTYNDAYGGCFDGECLVEMWDGRMVKAKNIKKGDRVRGPSGAAQVICVVRTKTVQSLAPLVEFEGGLKITAWHPIRINGEWAFPGEIRPLQWVSSEEIFSYVLDQGHSVRVNNIECVTLGHNFQEDIARHPYFGSNLVIQDLQTMRGWDNGLVELSPAAKRNPQTGTITALLQPTQAVF